MRLFTAASCAVLLLEKREAELKLVLPGTDPLPGPVRRYSDVLTPKTSCPTVVLLAVIRPTY